MIEIGHKSKVAQESTRILFLSGKYFILTFGKHSIMNNEVIVVSKIRFVIQIIINNCS